MCLSCVFCCCRCSSEETEKEEIFEELEEDEELDEEESLSEENCMSWKIFFSLFLSLGVEEVVGSLCIYFLFFLYFYRRCRGMVGEYPSVRSGYV